MAMPSSSTSVVTKSASSLSSGWAFPIATATPPVKVPASKPDEPPSARKTFEDVAGALTWIDSLGASGLDGHDLRELGLKNGSLTVDDRRNGKRWTFDGINVKLQKAGGIVPARQLASRAKDHALGVMVGQMFETPLGSAASLVVAATSENVVLTDLDMDLDLHSFSSGKVPFENGARYPLSAPGFDFHFDEEKIRQLEANGLFRREVWRGRG